MAVADHIDTVRHLVGRAVTSYADAYGKILDAREYHFERSLLPYDDADAKNPGVRIEIPLLWGTF